MFYLKFAIEIVGVVILGGLFVLLLPAATALVAMACFAWFVWLVARLANSRVKPTDVSGTARHLPS